MKKAVPVFLTALLIVFVFSVTAEAAKSDYIVENGKLTGYTGTALDVVLPGDVAGIASGAFPSGSVSSVTVLNPSCAFEEGSVAPDIGIRGYAGSTAEEYSSGAGCAFTGITETPSVTLAIAYLDETGKEVAPERSHSVQVYSPYSIESPEIGGYVCDIPVVSGSSEDTDIRIVVTYKKSADSSVEGWIVENNRVKYYDGSRGGFIVSGKETIDGVTRRFDENGYLILSGDTIEINGDTYYLLGSRISTGAVIIGDGIYYFDASGVMVKNASVDNNKYDAEGRMTAEKQFIKMNGNVYYLDGNTLFTGFLMLGDDIYFFGKDFAMKKDETIDGYTFDDSGKLSSVRMDRIKISTEETCDYNKKEQKPPVEVTLGDLVLTEGVHYTLEYSNNIDPGTAKIKVRGKGVFSGSRGVEFEIVGNRTFTLTVKYQNERGYEMNPPFVSEFEEGQNYRVESPDLFGYVPDTEVVEGTIEGNDVTIIVTYSPDKESETEPGTDAAAEVDSSSESLTETEDGSATGTGSDADTVSATEEETGDEETVAPVTTYTYSSPFSIDPNVLLIFFLVAIPATLNVAVIVFLIVFFDGKRRKNPKNGKKRDEESEEKPEPADSPKTSPVQINDEKAKTVKFDLNEIAVVDYDEDKGTSDFVDPEEVAQPQSPAHAPRRYYYRRKE